MNPISRKLNSRRGASILIALLLFLVCAFVGAAVLTSAYHNASRASAVRREQQAYLAAASAAELVKEAVTNTGIEMQYKTYAWVRTDYWTDEDGKPQSSTTTGTNSPTVNISAEYSGALKVIGEQVFHFFEASNLGTPLTEAWTGALSLSLAEYPELENVTGSVSVAPDYSVTVVLGNKPGQEGDAPANELKLTFKAQSKTSDPSVSSDTVTGDGYSVTTTTTTTTTTVTWNAPEIRLTSIPVKEAITP